MRQGGAARPQVAHHVQVPGRIPDLVRELVPAAEPRLADVVHQHVETAEALHGTCHGVSRSRGIREITLDRDRIARTGSHDGLERVLEAPGATAADGERAPASARRTATARPMPPVEPVTRHARSSRPSSTTPS